MPEFERLPDLLQEIAEGYSLSALRSAADDLSKRYRTAERNGRNLVLNETEAAAYAVARMPATLAACNAVFKEFKDRLHQSEFSSLLDIGAGTGGATLAALQKLSFKRVCCIERERSMLNIGKRLTSEIAADMAEINWICSDFTRNFEELPQADVVVAAYALNELSRDMRADAINRLFNLSSKAFLLIESGTPMGHQLLREAAELLKGKGGYVIAPCPSVGRCPLPAEDWCHFTVRVQRSRTHRLLKGGDAPFEDEKFSYLLVSREPIEPVGGRVLRHPKIYSGRVELKLCTKEGILLKSCTCSQKAAFKAARKASSGDSFECFNNCGAEE